MKDLSITDGTSVLLEFASLLQVDGYIDVACLEYLEIQQLYFQLQLTNVNIDTQFECPIFLTQALWKIKLSR